MFSSVASHHLPSDADQAFWGSLSAQEKLEKIRQMTNQATPAEMVAAWCNLEKDQGKRLVLQSAVLRFNMQMVSPGEKGHGRGDYIIELWESGLRLTGDFWSSGFAHQYMSGRTPSGKVSASIERRRILCEFLKRDSDIKMHEEAAEWCIDNPQMLGVINWGALCRKNCDKALWTVCRLTRSSPLEGSGKSLARSLMETNSSDFLSAVRRRLNLHMGGAEGLLRHAPALSIGLELWGDLCVTPSRKTMLVGLVEEAVQKDCPHTTDGSAAQMLEFLKTVHTKKVLEDSISSNLLANPEASQKARRM